MHDKGWVGNVINIVTKKIATIIDNEWNVVRKIRKSLTLSLRKLLQLLIMNEMLFMVSFVNQLK